MSAIWRFESTLACLASPIALTHCIILRRRNNNLSEKSAQPAWAKMVCESSGLQQLMLKHTFHAMKVDLFTGDHAEALEDHLDDIRKTLPYTKVEKSGIEEKNASRYFAEVERMKKEILRKLMSKAIKNASARIAIHRRPGQKLNDLFTHCMCRSKEECWSEFEADPVAAIEYLGDDVPSLSEIYDQACSMVHAAQQKLADKVRAERREFKYANTATGIERIRTGNLSTRPTFRSTFGRSSRAMSSVIAGRLSVRRSLKPPSTVKAGLLLRMQKQKSYCGAARRRTTETTFKKVAQSIGQGPISGPLFTRCMPRARVARRILTRHAVEYARIRRSAAPLQWLSAGRQICRGRPSLDPRCAT